MQTTRLPDGREATTPFHAGAATIPPQCEEHAWRAAGAPVFQAGYRMQLETCDACRWSRCVYAPIAAPKAAP